MEWKRCGAIAALVIATGAGLQAQAQNVQRRYPRMAPVHAYLMANRTAEVALARSAAPPAISSRAEVMVLGRQGFEVAAQGTNHFVCLVERSWDAAIGSAKFWDPEIRGPDCFNEAAAKSYLPIVLMKSRLALAGKSEAQIGEAVEEAFSRKKLPPMEPGAMSYMMSRQANLGGGAGPWHPHLMFFVPLAMSKSWGANLPGSPILAGDDAPDRLAIFMIPVPRWSDGTADSRAGKW
jgi:hypothetical protein